MQATNVAIEQVVQLAEARHQTTVIQMQDAAMQEHLPHMANLQREAEYALQRQAEEFAIAQHAHLLRVTRLQIALEYKRTNMCKCSLEKIARGRT